MVWVLHEKTYSCKLFLINSKRDRNFKTWLVFWVKMYAQCECCVCCHTHTLNMGKNLAGNKRKDHKTKIRFHNDVNSHIWHRVFSLYVRECVLVERKSLESIESNKKWLTKWKWAKKYAPHFIFAMKEKRIERNLRIFPGERERFAWSNGKMNGLCYTISAECSSNSVFCTRYKWISTVE